MLDEGKFSNASGMKAQPVRKCFTRHFTLTHSLHLRTGLSHLYSLVLSDMIQLAIHAAAFPLQEIAWLCVTRNG